MYHLTEGLAGTGELHLEGDCCPCFLSIPSGEGGNCVVVYIAAHVVFLGMSLVDASHMACD